jgi:hypothetical protein
MTARARSRALAALAGALAPAFAGCGASRAAGGAGDAGPALPVIDYVGAATDDALIRLLDAPPEDVTSRPLAIDSPPAGAALAVDSPGAFAFRATAALLRPGPRTARPTPPPAWRRALCELAELLGPEREAAAHGTPFNGTGFYLVVTDAASRPLLRAFTDQTSYTPGAEQWAALASGAQPLTLNITWAEFEENRIPAGSGPFVGGVLPFTVE